MLLDTHVCLWLLARPERIGPTAREAIVSAPSVRFSSVTIAEAALKRMLGRLDVPENLSEVLAQQGLSCLPLSEVHAAAIERFPALVRHDPFDRLLLAQASVERCSFVTADARLLSLGLDWVLDARR